MEKIGIGLYGSNGHQIEHSYREIRGARAVATCQVKRASPGGDRL